MEEMFDSSFIADESKAFIDEETSDCSGRHNPALRCANAKDYPWRSSDGG
jgi:hypothetical protein